MSEDEIVQDGPTERETDLDNYQEPLFKFPRIKLAMLCCTFSLIAWLVPNSEQYLTFSYNSFFVQRYYWTIITSQFVHANILHLFGNLIFLYVFGSTVIKYASDRFMFLSFLIGGAAGMFVSGYFYGPNVTILGASPGIMALAAMAVLSFSTGWPRALLISAGIAAFLYFMYSIAVSYSASNSGIAYVGHIIGFVAGIAEGVIWVPEWQKNLKVTVIMLIAFLVILFVLKLLDTTYVGGTSLI